MTCNERTNAGDAPISLAKKEITVRKGRTVSQPTPQEIATAVTALIKRAQASGYARELCVISSGGQLDPSSPIAKCLPYIDEQGLLRVGGCLKNAPVSFDVRHPIILPQKAKITERLVREIHLRCGHASPLRTLPEVQRHYWITAPRRVISRVVDRCTLRHRLAANTQHR